MEKTKIHITEYRGDQDINYFGITSFKVQNHGESVVEINTIPIYPGKTVKIIEEDGTECDFKLVAKFTEQGKIPKFRAIYKQFDELEPIDNLHQPEGYKVTLYNYQPGDIIDFSHNIRGHIILTRSFDYGITFPAENDIDLGFLEANHITGYNLTGSLETTSIQFRNNDLAANSEIFIIKELPTPFAVITDVGFYTPPTEFTTNVDGNIMLLSKPRVDVNGVLYNPINYPVPEGLWEENFLGFSQLGIAKPLDSNLIQGYDHRFKFRKIETGQLSEQFAWGDPR